MVDKGKARRRGGSGSYTESGAVVKRDRGLIRTALVYPNTYRAGMASLGFQTVYGLINDLPCAACERFFLPERGEKAVVPASVETRAPLTAFDIIAFSISFENDAVNLLSMLKLAGIPLRSSQRNQAHPMVMAGGVACFLNPEPLAEFVDLMLLGEAEMFLEDFFKIYSSKMLRKELFISLVESCPGVYIPSFYEAIFFEDGRFKEHKPKRSKIPSQVVVQHIPTLEKTMTTTRVLTCDTAFKESFLIETGRGCPHGCRFCSAGFIYRPPRFYPLEMVEKALVKAAEQTDHVGLVSAAVSDHPDINEICQQGLDKGLKISFSSLRVDALTDELIQSLVRSGVKTATRAPEAGSERMRRIINKKIDEEEILSAAERLVGAGILHLKLYFMIGLPFEKEEDIFAIITLTEKIRERFLEASRVKKKIGTITLSINPFIPKPVTPFQWTAIAPGKVLKARFAIIREGLKKMPNVKINVESFRMSRVNALLAMGDRRMADVLEDALDKGWAGAMRKHQDYCTMILAGYGVAEPLPWDILDSGVNKYFLKKEFHRGEKEKIFPDCPMIPCQQCNICR